MEAPVDDIANFQTALSELPRSMVLGPGGAVHPPSSAIFDEQGILLWGLLSKSNLWGMSTKFPGDHTSPRIESEGFLWSAHSLFHFSDLVNNYWKNLSQEEYLKRYEPIFMAFTKDLEFPKTLLKTLKDSLSGSSEGAMNVARIASAWTEKMLYVICQKNRPNTAVKSTNEEEVDEEKASDSEQQLRAIAFKSLKMKDMLAMPVIKEKLGPDRSYLMKLLVGPLHGLNCRNLLWHGFVAPHEWPTYLSGLLLGIAFSLALEWKLEITSDIYQFILGRLQSSLNFFDPYLLATSSLLHGPDSNKQADRTLVLLDKCRRQRQSIVDLIKRSSFVLNGSRCEWIYALDLLLQGRYFEAMVAFFPLLEASLRRVYVDANNISTFRLTAEPDTLCLSLDLILEDWLDREIVIQDRRTKRRLAGTGPASLNYPLPAGQVLEDEEDDEEVLLEEDGKTVNALFERLGQGNCSALFDILIWADTLGLRKHYRPRDQLAHGSAIPCNVSTVNVMHLLMTLLNLLQLGAPGSDPDTLTKSIVSPSVTALNDNDDMSVFELAQLFSHGYQPCFHKKRATIDAYWRMMDFIGSFNQKCAEVVTPAAAKLLRDAIAGEKKAEDVKWDKRCKARLIELEALKARVSQAIDGSKIARKSSEKFLSRDRSNSFPIKSPITLTCLIRLFHTSGLISSLHKLLENALQRFTTLRDAVVARTAWLQDRRHFAGLLETLPVYKLGAEIIMLMVKEILMHEDVAWTVEWVRSDNFTCDFPTFLWTLTQRMRALDSEGKYRRAEEVLDCLFISVPKIPEMLGKAEGLRTWLDIESYIWRLDCFTKGEELGQFRVFEHQRNAHVRELRRVMYGGAKADPRTEGPISQSEVEFFLLRHSLGNLIISPSANSNFK